PDAHVGGASASDDAVRGRRHQLAVCAERHPAGVPLPEGEGGPDSERPRIEELLLPELAPVHPPVARDRQGLALRREGEGGGSGPDGGPPLPVLRSQILTAVSTVPGPVPPSNTTAASDLPSGESAMALAPFFRPSRADTCFPVIASQRNTSCPADARVLPSAEKATA